MHHHLQRPVAYFSMEIGIDPRYHTYSGGLGILSGDTVKAAADCRVPLVAVSLVHEQGYFKQVLDGNGSQREEADAWKPSELLKPIEARASVEIEGRTVHIRAWRADVLGATGHIVPVYFLDTNLEENDERDRALTQRLYGGDSNYRLRQEIVLGVGGVRMLKALGLDVAKYHMNEGHSALLVLELLAESKAASGSYQPDEVRNKCVFTTHTPVAAGHDAFTREQFEHAWPSAPMDAPSLFTEDNKLNMTLLALAHADYVNGVAKKHGEVSRQLFPGYQIDSITNGIHAGTWMSHELQQVFDQHFPGWRADASMLRYALGLPARIVQDAHTAAKARLITHVAHTTGVQLKQDVFTIGFARRATAYKRADLLLRDPERLRIIAERAGGLQIIYAGKAHMRDTEGKHIIERIHQVAASLKPAVTVVFVPGYAMELASLMVAGVDLWLNTPLPPYEASGTSGMKAAVNGVPSLSVLDGWWIEGCLQGVTGWSFGTMPDDNLGRPEERDAADTAALYEMLEHTIVPTWKGTPDAWASVMRSSIALNGSFFNTHRMIQEYVMRAYFQ